MSPGPMPRARVVGSGGGSCPVASLNIDARRLGVVDPLLKRMVGYAALPEFNYLPAQVVYLTLLRIEARLIANHRPF
jgi:hypothetical protein